MKRASVAAVSLLLGLAAATARAEAATFQLAGHIREIVDVHGVFGGRFTPGMPFHAVAHWDTELIDLSPSPNVGSYRPDPSLGLLDLTVSIDGEVFSSSLASNTTLAIRDEDRLTLSSRQLLDSTLPVGIGLWQVVAMELRLLSAQTPLVDNRPPAELVLADFSLRDLAVSGSLRGDTAFWIGEIESLERVASLPIASGWLAPSLLLAGTWQARRRTR